MAGSRHGSAASLTAEMVVPRAGKRKDSAEQMNKSNPISILVIIAAVALAAYFVYPSVMYYSKTPQERLTYARKHPTIVQKVFNLGLDLQGGMRMVLEVDRSKLEKKEQKDLLDRAYTVIENRINGLGVTEPTIQKQGKDRLIVELPGLKDERAAKNVIGRTAQLEFKLLREPAQLRRAVKTIDKVLKGETVEDTAAADTAAKEEEEAKELAEELFVGSEKEKEDTAQAAPETPAEEEELLEGVSSFRELLATVQGDMIGATRQNKAKIDAILAQPDVREALDRAGLGGNDFLWGHDTSIVDNAVYRTLYYVKGHPEMRGDVIKDARAAIDQSGLHGGNAKVELEMNSRGARRFSSVTAANVNKYLAIVLDSTVYSSPRIVQKIPLGRAEITGSFSMEEARNLAIVLRAGALPAPVDVIEERIVGPSLGQDSIIKGLYACAIGFFLVVLFMIVYYKLSGVIADIALLLNLLFVLAIMAGLNATLTLPGIAGLILIIGMSVDANVIIFERIREELAVGKTVRSAVGAGFSRAFLTIMDANITTLITAGILYWIGTGPIKGFAITLIFGIIVSLFTALFVSRVIFNIITANMRSAKLSI